MPKHILETIEKEEPIIFICGNNLLAKELIDKFIRDFKILHLTDSETEEKHEPKKYYKLLPESAYLLKNLEEKIDFAIVFLSDIKDKKYLQHILPKAIEDNAKTLILVDVNFASDFYDAILEYNRNENVRFVLTGDIYDKSALKSKTSKIIQNAFLKKSVTLSGNDLEPLFTIFLDDAIEGINQILFSNFKTAKIFNLFYNHPQTLVSAIHLIKRVEPDLEIKFKQEKNAEENQTYGQIEQDIKTKFGFIPEYLDEFFVGFEKSLRILSEKGFEEEKENQPILERINSIKKTPQKVLTNRFLISAFIVSFIFYVLIVSSSLLLGISTFKTGVSEFKQGNLPKALTTIKVSQNFLSLAEPSIVLASQAKILSNNVSDLVLATQVSQIVKQGVSDLEIIDKLSRGVEREKFEKLLSDLYYLYFRTEQLKLESNNDNLNNLTNKELTNLLSLGPVLPQVLGFDKDKNYLLLFQNDGELRPTGGFIGSIGELTISKGRMKEIKIKDVYELDGQLKAHIEPNYIIRRFLQPHLYLRDTNFNPDFEIAASNAAQIYNLETQKQIDGVIGINFTSIKQIIKEIGPIKLPGYNKTIDENNAFEFLQSTIEDKFFPGSTGKKDVLNALFNQITLKLEKNPENYFKILKILPKLLSEKRILFVFNTNSIQKLFNVNGFSGSFTDLRDSKPDQLNDIFSINEANIGINKVNADVKRKVEYVLNLDQKDLTSKAIIEFENTSQKNDYKTYLRIIAPLGSKINSIKIDGKEEKIASAVTDFKIYESKIFAPPSGLEVDSVQDKNKQLMGFITTVPKSSKKTVEVIYKNGLTVPVKNLFSYSLLVYKQPGVEVLPFDLSIIYNPSIAPFEVQNAETRPGEIRISDTISQDKEFKMKLKKTDR